MGNRSLSYVLAILLMSVVTAMAMPPSAHESQDCKGCHQGGAVVARTQVRGVSVAADRTCMGCHQDVTTSSAHAFHSPARRDCTTCHAFHTPDRIQAGLVSFRVDMSRDDHQAHCASCHHSGQGVANLSAGHVEAAAVYHVDSTKLNGLSPSDGCLKCHSREGATATAGENAPRFAEHASHPFGMKVTPGAGNRTNHIRHTIDPRLPLFDERMECQTCHSLTESTESQLISFNDPYGLCLGCHAQEATKRHRLASLGGR